MKEKKQSMEKKKNKANIGSLKWLIKLYSPRMTDKGKKVKNQNNNVQHERDTSPQIQYIWKGKKLSQC